MKLMFFRPLKMEGRVEGKYNLTTQMGGYFYVTNPEGVFIKNFFTLPL